MPVERRDFTLTRIGHLIYLFGGWNNENYFNDLWIMNRTNHWQWSCITSQQVFGSAPPKPRRGHTASRIGNKIFIFGGLYGLSNYLNDLYIFHTETNTWELVDQKGEIPSPRAFHSVNEFVATNKRASINTSLRAMMELGKIENAGAGDFTVTDSEEFDLDPSLNGFLLLFGGTSGSNRLFNDLYLFNTNSFEWIRLPILRPPPGRCSHSAVLMGRELIVFGGLLTQTRPKSNFDHAGAGAGSVGGDGYIIYPTNELLSMDLGFSFEWTEEYEELESEDQIDSSNKNSSDPAASAAAGAAASASLSDSSLLSFDFNGSRVNFTSGSIEGWLNCLSADGEGFQRRYVRLVGEELLCYEEREKGCLPISEGVVREWSNKRLTIEAGLAGAAAIGSGTANGQTYPWEAISVLINSNQTNGLNYLTESILHPLNSTAFVLKSPSQSIFNSSNNDNPILNFLASPHHLSLMFNEFLSYCNDHSYQDYIHFYFDVENYRQYNQLNSHRIKLLSELSLSSELLGRAQQIHSYYLSSGSPREIICPNDLKAEILVQINNASKDLTFSTSAGHNSFNEADQRNVKSPVPISIDIFDSIQKSIYSFIRNEIIPKYVEFMKEKTPNYVLFSGNNNAAVNNNSTGGISTGANLNSAITAKSGIPISLGPSSAVAASVNSSIGIINNNTNSNSSISNNNSQLRIKDELTDSDKLQPMCSICLTKFTFLTGRLFCQCCESVCCPSCVPRQATLPPELSGGSGVQRRIRVCDICFGVLSNRAKHFPFSYVSFRRNRPLNLAAENSNTMKEWIAAFNETMKGTTNNNSANNTNGINNPSRPHKEGWLMKEDPTSQTFRRRYFILNNSLLYYYEMILKKTIPISNPILANSAPNSNYYANSKSVKASASNNSSKLFPSDCNFNYLFTLTTGGNQKFEFGAETEQGRMYWINAIKNAQNNNTSNGNSGTGTGNSSSQHHHSSSLPSHISGGSISAILAPSLAGSSGPAFSMAAGLASMTKIPNK